MANRVYPKALEALMNASVNLASDTIKAQLIDAGAYTRADAHDFLDDVPAGARIGSAVTLSNKATTGGTFSCDPATFTAVTGATIEAVLIYKHTGSDATAILLAYLDTNAAAAAIAITPTGTDVLVSFPSGVFTLTAS